MESVTPAVDKVVNRLVTAEQRAGRTFRTLLPGEIAELKAAAVKDAPTAGSAHAWLRAGPAKVQLRRSWRVWGLYAD